MCSILMQSGSIPSFWKLNKFQEYPVVVEQLVWKKDLVSFLRHQLFEQSNAELSSWQSLRKSAISDMVQSSTLLQSTLSSVRSGQRLMKVFKQRSASPYADLLLSLAYSLCLQQSSSLVSMNVLQSSPGDPMSESFPSIERAKGAHSKGKTLSQKDISSLVNASRSVVTAHRQLTSNSTISQSSKSELIWLASQSLPEVVSLQTSTTTLIFFCLRW